MAVEIKTIISETERRSAPKAAAGQLLSGRWVTLNGSGEAAYPGAGSKAGLYFLWEGSHVHIGTNADFSGSGNRDSTVAEELPSNKATLQNALVYGQFVAKVGSEGVDPAASLSVGDLCAVDAYGRLIAVGGGIAVAKVEAVTSDGGGITSLTFKALGN